MNRSLVLLLCLCIASIAYATVSKSVDCTAGSLTTLLTPSEKTTVTDLLLTGTIDARDFKTMRDDMPLLSVLDLSQVSIAAYAGTEGTFPGEWGSHEYYVDEFPVGAFYDYQSDLSKTSLTNVILPNSIVAINEKAFNGCTGLTSLMIPANVLRLEIGFISDCSNISTIQRPPLVEYIANGAFMSSYANIVVDGDNLYFSGSDGVLFNKDKTSLLSCPISKIGSYTVPSTVTSIVDDAFYRCTALTTVNLNEGLISIGTNSFYACTHVTDLTISSTVTTIANYAFNMCIGLVNIYAKPFNPVDLIGKTHVFDGINQTTCVLHVSIGTIPVYRSWYKWMDFVNMVEMSGFNLSANHLTLGYQNGSSDSIFIHANMAWKTGSDQIWLTVGPESGTGDDSLVFVATENPTIQARQATVTISGIGADSVFVIINQEAGDTILTVSSATSILGKEAGSNDTIRVTSNTTWNANSDQPWLTASPTTETGTGNMVLIATVNPTIQVREATVAVSAIGADTLFISVTQQAGDTIFSVSSITSVIGNEEGSTDTVLVNSNIVWNACSDQSWLTVSPTSETGTENLVLYASVNPTILVREATVAVSAVGADTLFIAVTQQAGDTLLSVSSLTMIKGYRAGCKDTIIVNSNTQWNVNSNQPWLTVDPISGNGNDTLVFIAGENPTIQVRQAEITVSATGADSVFITINQQAGDTILTVSLATLTIAKAEGSKDSIVVTSNTTWNANSDQPWLTVSPTTETGTGNIVLTATVNPTILVREATVAVSAVGADTLFVAVTQQAGDTILSVLPSIASIAYKGGSSDTVYVTSNTDWVVSSDQTWLTISPNAGTGNDTVTFNATMNTSITPRTALLFLSTEGICFDTITITQTGFQTSQTLDITAGGLSESLDAAERHLITNLTLTGTIDARDFKTMRDSMDLLARIDLSDANILEYTGTQGTGGTTSFSYLANEVPNYAFCNSTSFEGKASLISVILPSSATRIGDGSLRDCQNIASFELPPLVNAIDNGAFNSCMGLTSLNITPSVTSISTNAFLFSNILLTVDNDNSKYSSIDGVLFNKDQSTLIIYPTAKLGSYVIPSSVRVVGKLAFQYCSNLTSVTLPAALDSIVDQAFWSCSKIMTVTLPDGVSYIGGNAFKNCDSLRIALFEGNAPVDFGTNVFDATYLTFKINYRATQSGFTSPTWNGYPCFPLNEYVPIADAGPDQSINEESLVTLDGSGSSDSDGNGITYRWTAPDGINLSSATAVNPTFTTPVVDIDTQFTFILIVNDGAFDSQPDTVVVEVLNVFSEIQNELQVSTTNLTDGEVECYNAYNTISVAGDGKTVVLEDRSSATFIAGQSIRFLPGFHAKNGSYVDAHITTDGSFCDAGSSGSIVAVQPEVEKSLQEIPHEEISSFSEMQMKVYPNPNCGKFTIELVNFGSVVQIVVFNATGTIIQKTIASRDKTTMDLLATKWGIYFVRAIDGEKQITQKVIVH